MKGPEVILERMKHVRATRAQTENDMLAEQQPLFPKISIVLIAVGAVTVIADRWSGISEPPSISGYEPLGTQSSSQLD